MNRCLLACCVAVLVPLSASRAECQLKDGDRLLFLGDSITEARHYSQYVGTYLALHFPELTLSLRNAGASGDTAEGALNRLSKDVLAVKPTVVSVTLGINDWKYKTDADRLDWYRNSTAAIVRELKSAGVRPVLLGPGCVDPDRRSGDGPRYNAILKEFSAAARNIAQQEHTAHFDLYSLMLDVQAKTKAEKPDASIIPDSIHPGTDGHAVMAYALLKALDVVGPASGLSLDVAARSAKPDRCQLAKLQFSDAEITFTRRDQSLPAYFPVECDAVLKHLGAQRDINNYPFQATGLKAGTWKLSVDGLPVAEFTAEQLSAGVNLGVLPGPWRALGERIIGMLRKQDSLYFIRWRTLVGGGLPPEVEPERQALIARLDEVMDEMDRQRTAAIATRDWEWQLTWMGNAGAD